MKRVQLGEDGLEQETVHGKIRLQCPIKSEVHILPFCAPECVWFDVDDDGDNSYATCKGSRIGQFEND